MKTFLSLDIETSGLKPEEDQILELGCVIGDFTRVPVEELPWFRAVVIHERISGHPFALNMNAGLINEITQNKPGGGYYPNWEDALLGMWKWLRGMGFPLTEGRKVKFTPAGKNFNAFDLQFLQRIGNWGKLFGVAHRTFDPGPLFYRHEDEKIPDMKLCLERAGISSTVTHTAIDDARIVVALLRAFYGERGEK